jgi:hypothetical protein
MTFESDTICSTSGEGTAVATDSKKKLQEILDEQSEEVRRVISEVFNVERSRLYQRHPRGLGSEIAKVVKDIVK